MGYLMHLPTTKVQHVITVWDSLIVASDMGITILLVNHLVGATTFLFDVNSLHPNAHPEIH